MSKTDNFPSWMLPDEKAIIDALITAILNRGFEITAYDEESGPDFPLKATKNRADIQAEVAATDETLLAISDDQDNICGVFILIHGNGPHVLSDFTDNPVCNTIADGLSDLIEHWEGQ